MKKNKNWHLSATGLQKPGDGVIFPKFGITKIIAAPSKIIRITPSRIQKIHKTSIKLILIEINTFKLPTNRLTEEEEKKIQAIDPKELPNNQKRSAFWRSRSRKENITVFISYFVFPPKTRKILAHRGC